MNEEKKPLENQELSDGLMAGAAAGEKPLLALVPIPALNMEEAAVDFELSLSTEERIRRNQCR